MTNTFCIKCTPLFSEIQILHHKKVLSYQRDWFELKIENNKLRDEIQDLKELLKMHHDAKIELAVNQ